MGKSNKKEVGAIVSKDGVSFRVWAPFAEAVAVAGSFNNWAEQPLVSEGDGYWWAKVESAEAGQEYKFVIKNGDTFYRNDPRALNFTTTAGNSVITDLDFDWDGDTFQPTPVEKQVIYELHVGTFNRPDPANTGTFDDVADKLDYLAELGINMIELMPISSMSMDRGWGYATDYIYAVESLYGGRYRFLQLVKEAHKRGIGIILDVVYNHFGPDNSLDLWQFDGWSQDGKGGIYFYNDWRAETPWGNTRPDYGRPEVQQYILDNVKSWMHDCRVDGLRVDSTIFIRNAKGYNNDPSTDLPEGWQLLQRINKMARKINPAAVTIAEDLGGNEYLVKPIDQGGAGFGAQWQLGFPQALREALWTDKPEAINLTAVCAELTQRYNNDAFQRIIYSDSHDSAANGAARLWEIIAPGKTGDLFARRQSLLAAAFLLTAPGIPMLFQGQEFMTGGSFNDWQALDWEMARRHQAIITAYQHLIALRKNGYGNTAGLSGRDVNITQLDENNKVLAFHRWYEGGPRDDVMVIINFGNQSYDSYDVNFPRSGTWKVRFNSTWKGYSQDFKNAMVIDVEVETGRGSLKLPPSCALILSQDD